MGQKTAGHRPELATGIGSSDSIFRLSGRDPKNHLYDHAIESLHMQLRKVLKNRGHFPSDEAATKLIYLAICNITKKWKDSRSPRSCLRPNSPSSSANDFSRRTPPENHEKSRRVVSNDLNNARVVHTRPG